MLVLEVLACFRWHQLQSWLFFFFLVGSDVSVIVGVWSCGPKSVQPAFTVNLSRERGNTHGFLFLPRVLYSFPRGAIIQRGLGLIRDSTSLPKLQCNGHCPTHPTAGGAQGAAGHRDGRGRQAAH